MLISRIAVLVLTVICLKEWSLLFLGKSKSKPAVLLKIDLCVSCSVYPTPNCYRTPLVVYDCLGNPPKH